MALTEIITDQDFDAFFNVSAMCSEDTALLRLVKRFTESSARRYVGHGIAQATYTEFHRKQDIGGREGPDIVEMIGSNVYFGSLQSVSNDGHILQVDNAFLRSVTSLYEDPAAYFGTGGSDFAASTELTQGTHFFPELDSTGMCKSGRLIRVNRDWCNTPGTIKVTYVAGFTASELDDEYAFVKLALLEEMQDQFQWYKGRRNAGGGPVISEKFANDYSVTYAVQQRSAGELSAGARQKLQPIRRIAL